MQLFEVRQAMAEPERLRRTDAEDSPEYEQELEREETAWSRYWHGSFRLTGPSVFICRRCKRHRLNRTEREILVMLILDQLALLEDRIRSCADVLVLLALPNSRKLDALRMLSDEGKLARAKLVAFDEPNEDISERRPMVDPGVVETILFQNRRSSNGWSLRSEADLYDRLEALTRVLARKSEAVESLHYGRSAYSDAFKWTRKADQLLDGLKKTLEVHSGWKLNSLLSCRDSAPEWIMVLALLGKELGHLHADHQLFTGGGLARAASRDQDYVQRMFRFLRSDGDLVRTEMIQACGGAYESPSDNPTDLEHTEFELTTKSIEILDLGKRLVKRRSGEFCPRKPRVQMKQLVLSDDVWQALQMALTHAKNGRTMIDEWGIGELVPYGRSPSLLFSGPPGTGKTATAEALACELGKPILVADYSRIQSCYVGQTEKNIVRIFREAKSHDAVLFWDEADAIFFDRDSAHRNWEVRDVNVLLQELERFDGVCILATNRKIVLDKALERRIALKVEFARPDPVMRRRIWKRLLPKRMPVAKDVDIDQLSHADLSGGEIKNAVLNAARIALQRNRAGPVTMQDFQQAIAVEQRGWCGRAQNRIGFG
jgi:hypothetical protein